MRKTSSLDALFSRPVQGILTTTFMEPSKWWYLSDLARRLGLSPSSLQRPLAALSGAGILSRKKEGNRVYYRAHDASPLFADIQSVIAKTAGIVELLREALMPLRRRIDVAFVYGSIARSLERPESDIDLMVVGSASLADLASALRSAETRLGRPVNVNIYAPVEFRRRLTARTHFLESVLDREKLFVIGTEHDLEKARSGGPSRAARHKQGGALQGSPSPG